jgi:tetratricopeptide (TPR) repeat protein
MNKEGSAVLVATLGTVLLAALPARAAERGRDNGLPVTIVTLKGETFAGAFLEASASEVTLRIGDRTVLLPLTDVSYISFSGDAPRVGSVTLAPPSTPVSSRRMVAFELERSGRLDEALREYVTALELDPSDRRTKTAVERVRQKIKLREGRNKALEYKRLTGSLKEAGRYREAAACYDEALRLDPADEKFREKHKHMRQAWQPSACPTATPTPDTE